jgi:protein O-mannosyl-transferase
LARLGGIVFLAFVLYYSVQTSLTAISWGDPLKMASELAWRAPQSPRAQYELGRTYIIYSRYDIKSPLVKQAYAPLERAAALPGASILPLQAMIFLNARLHIQTKGAWWDKMTEVLRSRRPGVEDESSLIALTQCLREGMCEFPADRLLAAYQAALSHPNPSSRLLGAYGDFAWNILQDHQLAERVVRDAIAASPTESAYRITLVRMLIDNGNNELAEQEIRNLETLNYGGSLQTTIDELHRRLQSRSAESGESGLHTPPTNKSLSSSR